MVRASGMVGVGFLVLSLPKQAFGMSIKQKQRAACRGMRSGDVSHEPRDSQEKEMAEINGRCCCVMTACDADVLLYAYYTVILFVGLPS